MAGILDIRIQKLFFVTVVLKVGSSFLGWYFQYQWSLGFAVPLAIMAGYVALGIYRRDRDVSDEKFADSCYYLGFIFTITSIIFSLFDLPNIGTKLQDIAVRFGAAMVSTVAGLVVRVYLVGFKKDVQDAIRDAEDGIIVASEKFREQLVIAFERLADFQSEVDKAARGTVERVNLQVEALSKNHADRLTGFFEELTSRNQAAFTEALSEVKTASLRLAESVDGYSHAMRTNLGSIENKVTAFTEAIAMRLRTTTFPDDYFAKHLAEPLDSLKNAAGSVSAQVMRASSEVGASTTELSAALKKMRAKASATEDSLETVLKLTNQQQAVLESAQTQFKVLDQLVTTLAGFDSLLAGVVSGIDAANTVTTELTDRVETLVLEREMSRRSLEDAMSAISTNLGAQTTATEGLTTRIAASTAAAESVAAKLDLGATTAERLAGALSANLISSDAAVAKLSEVAAIGSATVKQLGTLGEAVRLSIERANDAAIQLQTIARQLGTLDAALQAQGRDIRTAAERAFEPRAHSSSYAVVAMGGLGAAGHTEVSTDQPRDDAVVPPPPSPSGNIR